MHPVTALSEDEQALKDAGERERCRHLLEHSV